MPTVKVFIKGDEVKALYNDSFNILGIADDVTVERATDVYFNNETKEWEIKLLAENRVLPFAFKKRADAIAYEVEYLEKRHIEQCQQ